LGEGKRFRFPQREKDGDEKKKGAGQRGVLEKTTNKRRSRRGRRGDWKYLGPGGKTPKTQGFVTKSAGGKNPAKKYYLCYRKGGSLNRGQKTEKGNVEGDGKPPLKRTWEGGDDNDHDPVGRSGKKKKKVKKGQGRVWGQAHTCCQARDQGGIRKAQGHYVKKGGGESCIRFKKRIPKDKKKSRVHRG